MNAIAHAGRILVLAAALAGCASSPPTSDPFGGDASRPIRVDVVNRNFNDATVWAITPSERVRLGTVTGKTESSFTIPWKGRSEPMQMEIDLVGGGRCLTETLTIDEGDVLYLQIELELSQMKICR